MRELIGLKCESCKRINYTTEKNRRTTTEKIELDKYCKKEKRVIRHKETKL